MNANVSNKRASTALCPIQTAAPHDPFRVNVAKPADESKIDGLRQSAYAKAGYFSIPDTELLRRKNDPDNSVCLIIANKKEIAATVRLSFTPRRSIAETVLQGPAPLEEGFFPTLTLCRGATNPLYRGQGLMTFLVGLGVAVARRAELPSATGMQAEGTPHFGTMIASGWQSKDVPSAATQCVRMEADGMKLVFIGRERFGYSADYGNKHHQDLHKSLRSDEAVRSAASVIVRMRRGN